MITPVELVIFDCDGGYAGGLTPAQWLEGPTTTVFDDMRELPTLLAKASRLTAPANRDAQNRQPKREPAD